MYDDGDDVNYTYVSISINSLIFQLNNNNYNI